jgi:hypothetical protein
MAEELSFLRVKLSQLVSLQMVIDAQDLQLASAQGELLRLRRAIDVGNATP